MKNTFVTSEFKKYIKHLFKTNGSIVTEIDGDNYFLANDFFMLRTDAETFNAEILPLLNADKIPSFAFNHSGSRCPSPKNIYNTCIKEARKDVYKTKASVSLPAGNREYFANVFKCERNGILINESYLNLFNIEQATFKSNGRATDMVFATVGNSTIIFLPIRCPANFVDLVQAIVSAS